jgi:L-histidine N-alpha-methyltransferase
MTHQATTRSHASARHQTFADEVQYYLSLQPRQLPSRYLYDALGSALFEAICRLPWYRITRAETRLLAAHRRSVFDRLDPLTRLVELGPGSGEKLVTVIGPGDPGAPGNDDQSRPARLDVHLVDVSPAALAASSRSVGALDGVTVATHRASYEAGLAEAVSETQGGGRTLVLFLGSNIGNFDPPGADAFLRGIRSALDSEDACLIGADLVKDERELILAYDDPLGVTAAFNRNLLVRINRELGGDFNLDAFTHRAVWNAEQSRVEMHLVSLRRQRVRVAAAGLEFTMEKGESIWTESSYKYQPAAIVTMLEGAGFRLVEQWVDGEAGFALTLSQVT